MSEKSLNSPVLKKGLHLLTWWGAQNIIFNLWWRFTAQAKFCCTDSSVGQCRTSSYPFATSVEPWSLPTNSGVRYCLFLVYINFVGVFFQACHDSKKLNVQFRILSGYSGLCNVVVCPSCWVMGFAVYLNVFFSTKLGPICLWPNENLLEHPGVHEGPSRAQRSTTQFYFFLPVIWEPMLVQLEAV